MSALLRLENLFCINIFTFSKLAKGMNRIAYQVSAHRFTDLAAYGDFLEIIPIALEVL